ncbi:unnamed protein product [Boreogadus saida]
MVMLNDSDCCPDMLMYFFYLYIERDYRRSLEMTQKWNKRSNGKFLFHMPYFVNE